MNRIAVFTLVCIMVLWNTNVQAKVRLKSTAGIGMAYAKATQGDMLYRPFFAPHVTSGLTIPLSKRITFESGLAYTLKGFNNKFDLHLEDEVIKFRGKLRLHYASVPLIINYNVYSKGDYRFWAGAGMEYGLFIGGIERVKVSKYENDELLSTISEKTPVKSALYGSNYLASPNSKNIQFVDAIIRLQVNCVWKDRYIFGVFHQHGLQDIESKRLSDGNSIIKLRYTGFSFGILWN